MEAVVVEKNENALWHRPLGDPIWPVFVACLCIGFAELGAFVCVLASRSDLAFQLDGYWLLGLILSNWLLPSLDRLRSKEAKRWVNAALADELRTDKLRAAVGLSCVLCVAGASVILAQPWATLVHGIALGPYILTLCYLAATRGLPDQMGQTNCADEEEVSEEGKKQEKSKKKCQDQENMGGA